MCTLRRIEYLGFLRVRFEHDMSDCGKDFVSHPFSFSLATHSESASRGRGFYRHEVEQNVLLEAAYANEAFLTFIVMHLLLNFASDN